LGFKRRPALNGEDSTFSTGFAVPGVGRNPEATGLLKRSGHRDQSRLDQQAENNWSLCVSSAGTADANTAAHAALHFQSVLRRDYDLMAD
jgi:hypothetical protein